MRKLKCFWRDERGATAIEYGLIASLVFLGCATAFFSFGDSLAGIFKYISDTVIAAVA